MRTKVYCKEHEQRSNQECCCKEEVQSTRSRGQTYDGKDLQKKKEGGKFLEDGDDIPEPEIWFHDILRKDGTAYNEKEVEFIKAITARS